MYEDDDTSWSFAIGLFVGALAGAAAASLFTPRSGPQNRELVLEKGVVLKDRVADATTSATTSVKDTTSSAVTSVKDATNSAVTKVSDTVGNVRDKASVAAGTVTDAAASAAAKVSETASTTVEKLQSAASVAAEKVSDVTSTASERASVIAEKVSDATSTATEKVSTLAHTATDKVSSVASSAADKARDLRGQTAEGADVAIPAPATSAQVSGSSYDAEDVRPAATSTAPIVASSATTQPLQTLSSLDTFEPTMADTTASTTIDPADLALADTEPSTADVYDSQFSTQTPSTATAAQAELGSAEQFEVSDTLDEEQGGSAARSA